MRKHKGFTLVEILVVLIIIAGLSFISFNAYRGAVEKSKSAEALMASGAIRRAEEGYKLEKGTYVGAQSTEEINEILGLGIKPKYYEFQIIGADENNFTIIARRIQGDIDAGMVPDDQIMIAMDQTGKITTGGSQSWGGEGTGASSGGGTVSGGGGTTGGSGGTTDGGGGTTGGSGGIGFLSSATIEGALGLLMGSSAGLYNYNLIVDNSISVIFDDFTKYEGVENAAAFWWGTVRNTIYINDEYETGTPEEAIAAMISHEATHADYEYNEQKWIDLTLLNHPELTEEDIHIPGNSIDQEYNCFESQVQVWNEIKGGKTDQNNDAWADYYAQGEDYMKAMIKLSYSEEELPEY